MVYTSKDKVIWTSQHGFTMVKSRLPSSITFYNDITGLVDEENSGQLPALLSVRLLALLPIKSSWRRWLNRGWVSRQWGENWLDSQVHRVVVTSSKPIWSLEASGVPRTEYWNQSCWTSSLMIWMMGQICSWYRTGWTGWYTRRLCCHP